MNEVYVIKGETLSDIADAIREQTGETETIEAQDFADKILSIDLTTEEYMRLSDLMEYPKSTYESNYTAAEIAKVNALIEHFESLGGENDGE